MLRFISCKLRVIVDAARENIIISRSDDWGSDASPVRLSTDLRGGVVLPMLPATLRAAWSVGVDLNPVEIEDEDAVTWLRALVWPENVDQQEELLAAIQVAK